MFTGSKEFCSICAEPSGSSQCHHRLNATYGPKTERLIQEYSSTTRVVPPLPKLPAEVPLGFDWTSEIFSLPTTYRR